MKQLRFLLCLCALLALTGCATYITPSGRADLSAISSSTMKESFAAKPAAQLPAYIACVRVQAPAYRSYYTEREGGVHGTGRYSVITTREIEEASDLERISKMTDVGGLASLSRLLIPEHLNSDAELREAAARLKADLIFLYTFDTTFHDNDKSVALNVVSLGLSPTRKISVHVTASALIMDTRTGFIYAALESNEKRLLTSNAWESSEAADRARQEAEKAAFKSLLKELEKSWSQVVSRAKQGA